MRHRITSCECRSVSLLQHSTKNSQPALKQNIKALELKVFLTGHIIKPAPQQTKWCLHPLYKAFRWGFVFRTDNCLPQPNTSGKRRQRSIYWDYKNIKPNHQLSLQCLHYTFTGNWSAHSGPSCETCQKCNDSGATGKNNHQESLGTVFILYCVFFSFSKAFLIALGYFLLAFFTFLHTTLLYCFHWSNYSCGQQCTVYNKFPLGDNKVYLIKVCCSINRCQTIKIAHI